MLLFLGFDQASHGGCNIWRCLLDSPSIRLNVIIPICCAPAQQPSKIIIPSNKIPFCLMECLKFRRDKLSYWMVDFSLATDLLKYCIPIEQISWATLEQWCQWFRVIGWLILSLGVLIRICGYNVNLLVHARTNIILDMFYYRLKNMLGYHVITFV